MAHFEPGKKKHFDQKDTEESKFRIKIVQKRRISQFFAQKRRKTAPKVPKNVKIAKIAFLAVGREHPSVRYQPK